MMKELRRFFWVAVALATGGPGLGAALQGLWSITLVMLVAGALWLGARQRRWLAGWSSALCIAGLVVAAWLDVGMGWLLPGMVGALAAWDLDAFGSRLADRAHIGNERRLIGAHLRRLGAVSGIGLLLGAAALLIRVQLGFGLALILASLAVLGTALVLHQLGRQPEDGSEHGAPPA